MEQPRWTWPTIASAVVHTALCGAVLVSQFTKDRSEAPPAGATIVDVMAVPVLPPAPKIQPPPDPELA